MLLLLLRHPGEYLVRRWNWKSALTSALIRATIFFSVNIRSGWRAGLSAMLTELVFRGLTSGFYGSLTQAFRRAEPAWAAAVTAMILLPIFSHMLEFLVHWLRGTTNLKTSIVASVAFTVISTLFNLFAMRRGVLVVGEPTEAGKPPSLGQDFSRMPRVILDFLLVLPRTLWNACRSRGVGL